jgi:hypothetical protein
MMEDRRFGHGERRAGNIGPDMAATREMVRSESTLPVSRT